jgi:penicillin-binding protein 2
MKLGIDRLAYYASGLGVGHKTGIDLPAEEAGLMPSQEWVERTFHRKWYAGEVISVSTGQGAVQTTPLQLARLIGGIASGGVFKQPHMLKDAPNVGEERFHISEDTVEKVTEAMYGVINEPHGTGGQLKLANVEFSGKSGTAQVIGYNKMALVKKGSQFADNAWFVGYAPKRNPEICVAALVQESGQHGGEAAGPVVRDVVKAYYDKRTKRTEGITNADATKPDGTKPYDPTKATPAPAATVVQPVMRAPDKRDAEPQATPARQRTPEPRP